MSTFFMNLTLPKERRTASTTWATNINTALTTVDSHDHTDGKGQRLTPAGIEIDDDLPAGGRTFTSVGEATFSPEGSSKNLDNSLWTDSGELTFIDDDGVQIQLTQAGAINISGFGGIDGDYSSTTATLLYVDSTSTYEFYDSLSALATVRCKDVTVAGIQGTSASLASLNQDGSASLQAVSASGSVTVSGDAALSGNVTGRGIIPVGAVVAVATNLAGVSIPAGFLEMNGQTVSDVASPMNGVVLPNVSNSQFLMGSTTAGTSGGAASYSLLTANIPAHVHTIDHGHSNTFALSSATVSSETHYHNMAHVHQFEETTFLDSDYALRSIDDSAVTIPQNSSTLLATETFASIASGSGATNIVYAGSFAGDGYTTGAIDPPVGSGSSAEVQPNSSTQTVTLTGSISGHSGSSGSAGQALPTSLSLLPKYVTTKFVIRYK